MIDLPEILASIGIAFLGYAIYVLLSCPGVLGYCGILLIIFGLFLASRPKKKPAA